MKILITGGAGYIGSHVVAALGEKGADILVYDNLSTSHKDSMLYNKLVVGDLNDKLLLEKTIKAFKPHAVLHLLLLSRSASRSGSRSSTTKKTTASMRSTCLK